MRTEKIIISFFAILIGVVVAGIVFYFYQQTKVIPPAKIKKVTVEAPTPTPENANILTIDSPKDEEVVDKKTLTISGKTNADSIIVISANNSDQVITPAKTGNFVTTLVLEDGANEIEITSIEPNGFETKQERTVTYSTENF